MIRTVWPRGHEEERSMTGRSVTGARHGASCYFRTAAEDGDRKALAPLGQSRPLAAPAEPEGQRRAERGGRGCPRRRRRAQAGGQGPVAGCLGAAPSAIADAAAPPPGRASSTMARLTHSFAMSGTTGYDTNLHLTTWALSTCPISTCRRG